MIAGEILERINGLTHDKLTYFVRAGYIKPEKIKKGTLNYNNFSERDSEIIKRAWKYIQTYDMRTKSAFIRAEAELDDPHMSLL